MIYESSIGGPRRRRPEGDGHPEPDDDANRKMLENTGISWDILHILFVLEAVIIRQNNIRNAKKSLRLTCELGPVYSDMILFEI